MMAADEIPTLPLDLEPSLEGWETTCIHKTTWQTPQSTYTDLQPIGVGAFGTVCSAYDMKENRRVAIKKMIEPFGSKDHAKRAFREMHLLNHCNHENIVGLLDIFTSPGTCPDKNFDVYLVMQMMSSDLHSLLKNQALGDEHIQFFVYQVFRGLKYIHSAKIVHRDLKPNNIAVNENSELRILDFGLAREKDEAMTGYIATRWYRAPEVMLSWTEYDDKVDVWGVGCVMAEMLTRRPLFPGVDHVNLLGLMLELLGTPNEEYLNQITSESARNFIRTLPVHMRKPFQVYFNGANPEAIDLLEKILIFDPNKRISVEDALAHPYLSKYADPTDEPTGPIYIDPTKDADLSLEEWRKMIFEFIENFKPIDRL